MTVGDRPRYRWVILAIAFLVLLTSFSVRLAFANVSTILGRQLSLSATAVGAMITAFYIGYVAANAGGGFIADRIGSRRAIAGAMASLAIFTAVFSQVGNVVTGYVVQCAMGLSAGVYFSATTKLVGDWFPSRERGRAFGLIAMPSSLSVILANSLFPLIVASFSWQALYQILGGYIACVAFICVTRLRDAPAAPIAEEAATRPVLPLRALIADRDFVLLAIGGFGGMWATWGFAFWVNALLIRAHGMSAIEAGRVAAIFGLGALVAKPIYGLISDMLPIPRKFLVVICFIAFAVLLMAFGTAEVGMLRIIAPLLGITAFVYSPIQGAILTEMVGRNRLGAAAGIMNAFWQLGSVIVPVAVGAVFQASGSFTAAFAVLATGPVVGAVAMFAIREPAP